MLKAADALSEAGYRVRVVSTNHVPWAERADLDVRARRSWAWSVVNYRRDQDAGTWCRSGLRTRAAQAVSRAVGARRTPWRLVVAARSRVHRQLVQAALSEPADIFYGGTNGALAAVASAAALARVPFGIDLEDFHSGEYPETTPDGRLANRLAARIEERVLPAAAFVTTSSEAIAQAYRDRYVVAPVVVHNTFALPEREPCIEPVAVGALKLHWFSQTIGPGRGLENVVRAAGLASLDGELHLRGCVIPGFDLELHRLAVQSAPRLKIIFHEPVSPDGIVDSCRGYDIGLSLEDPAILNRALCLTNKALTYPLAGLAVIATDTEGHRPFMADVGSGGAMYPPGDLATLAAILRHWDHDRVALARAKAGAWAAARRRWHWEHAAERGALLDLVARVA